MDLDKKFQEQLNRVLQKISLGSTLIVDDNREVHRILRSLLSQTGIRNIKTAYDVKEAITAMAITPISLVICDYHLDTDTVIDVYKEMKARPRCAKTPLLVITNDVTRDELLLAKAEGIMHCILKPFTLDVLHEKIVEAYELSESDISL